MNFLQDYFLDDLDSILFENLKERLFCDIAKPNSPILYERWTQKFHFISRDEIEEFFSVLESNFQKDENPLSQINALIEENRQMIMENEKIKVQIAFFQNETLEFNDQLASLRLQNRQLIEDLNSRKNLIHELQSPISGLDSTISKLKSNLDSFPIAPFLKFDQNGKNIQFC
jgi:ABC-type phosphate transport system auxiliary subunit